MSSLSIFVILSAAKNPYHHHISLLHPRRHPERSGGTCIRVEQAFRPAFDRLHNCHHERSEGSAFPPATPPRPGAQSLRQGGPAFDFGPEGRIMSSPGRSPGSSRTNTPSRSATTQTSRRRTLPHWNHPEEFIRMSQTWRHMLRTKMRLPRQTVGVGRVARAKTRIENTLEGAPSQAPLGRGSFPNRARTRSFNYTPQTIRRNVNSCPGVSNDSIRPDSSTSSPSVVTDAVRNSPPHAPATPSNSRWNRRDNDTNFS